MNTPSPAQGSQKPNDDCQASTEETPRVDPDSNQALPLPGPSSGPAIDHQAADPNPTPSYHLKWIHWNSGKIPIVMQSRNGPCPLIALMNVLLLRERIKLPEMLEQITDDQLLAYIGECIMETKPDPAEIEQRDDADTVQLNFEQHIHDAVEIMPKLKNGLDVNIRFTGITDFEYTPECIIFDLLRIPLYHGWLVDPSMEELNRAIDRKSYNHLIDYIITNKTIIINNEDQYNQEEFAKVIMAEEFLDSNASQLTLYGLQELRSKIKDNEIGILFRNNHFLTLFKREGQIYTLVTDHGYLTEDNVIWETLDNIEGAGRYLDSYFQSADGFTNEAVEKNRQELDQQIALYLSTCYRDLDSDTIESEMRQTKEDFEMAKRLQMEEDQLANLNPAANTESWPQLGAGQQADDGSALEPACEASSATRPLDMAPSRGSRTSGQRRDMMVPATGGTTQVSPMSTRSQSLDAGPRPLGHTIGSSSSSVSRSRNRSSSGSKKSNCIVI